MARDGSLPAGPFYSERLRVPPRWWLVGALLVLSVWWVFVLATPQWFALAVAAVCAAVVALALWQYGNAAVEVTNVHLRAGTARIPLAHCGPATALDAAQTRALHGPQADARAFFLIRPYVATSVRVQVADPRDPTPYWLVGSRDPQRLVDVLSARRAAP